MNLTQRVSDMKKRLENAENNVQGQEAIVNQRRKVIDFINGDVLKAGRSKSMQANSTNY